MPVVQRSVFHVDDMVTSFHFISFHSLWAQHKSRSDFAGEFWYQSSFELLINSFFCQKENQRIFESEFSFPVLVVLQLTPFYSERKPEIESEFSFPVLVVLHFNVLNY